jgi:hypothetical protein
LQENVTEELTDLRGSTVFLGQQLHWLNNIITDTQVRFMATVDVTVVVKFLANFQIQIVLDL